MSQRIPLLSNHYYHIYNRGIDGSPIFREQRNYVYFLELYSKYIFPVVATYAYCLMNNHFHLLVRILTPDEQEQRSSEERCSFVPLDPSKQFASFFGTYTKSYNKAYQRTGSLFETPFKRKLVDDDAYFWQLTRYIHQNPERHGFADTFRDWKYSSWNAIVSGGATRVERDEVLDWFGGRGNFVESHLQSVDETKLQPYLIE